MVAQPGRSFWVGPGSMFELEESSWRDIRFSGALFVGEGVASTRGRQPGRIWLPAWLISESLVLNGPDFEVLSKGLDFCPRDRPLALRPKSRPYGLNMRFELINHFFHKTRIFELRYFHGSKYHLPSTFFSSLGNYILSAGLPCLPWEVDDPKARGWSKLNSTECFSNIFLTITDTTNKLWIHAKGALLRLSVEVPSLFCSIFCPNTEAATSDKRSSLINNSQCGRTPTWCTPLVDFWDGCLSKSFCWMF